MIISNKWPTWPFRSEQPWLSRAVCNKTNISMLAVFSINTDKDRSLHCCGPGYNQICCVTGVTRDSVTKHTTVTTPTNTQHWIYQGLTDSLKLCSPLDKVGQRGRARPGRCSQFSVLSSPPLNIQSWKYIKGNISMLAIHMRQWFVHLEYKGNLRNMPPSPNF